MQKKFLFETSVDISQDIPLSVVVVNMCISLPLELFQNLN